MLMSLERFLRGVVALLLPLVIVVLVIDNSFP